MSQSENVVQNENLIQIDVIEFFDHTRVPKSGTTTRTTATMLVSALTVLIGHAGKTDLGSWAELGVGVGGGIVQDEDASDDIGFGEVTQCTM